MGQRVRSFTLAPAAAVANNIALTQKPAAGGVQALTLNGALVTAGVATPDIPRRIGITSDGNDFATVFTVTGTGQLGLAITEVINGPNVGTVNTVNDFATVSKITVGANTVGNITVGTCGVVSTSWFPVDRLSSMDLGIQTLVSGVANYTIEQTNDEPFEPQVGVNGPNGPVTPVLTPIPHPVLQAQTVSGYGAISTGVTAVRLTLNSFTNPGSVKVTYAPGYTSDQ